MSERDRSKGIVEIKEIREKGNANSLIDLLMGNEISIRDKVISKKEKELINNLIIQIYSIDWNQEDARMKMMFDMSLIIDAIKNQIS
jgi:hypothetical protein